MDCLSIDFIGPLPPSLVYGFKYTHILLVINYFSRYVWAFTCTCDTGAEVVRCLPSIFRKFGVPVGFYSDPGSHFGKATKEYVVGAGAVWVTSPVTAKKATGMIEKAVQIIQQVLGKTLHDPKGLWAPLVGRAELEVNRRSITHLGFSPCEIFLGFQSALELETEYSSHHRGSLRAALKSDECFGDKAEREESIINFIVIREQCQTLARTKSDEAKLRRKECHDLVIRQKNHEPNQLVMLYGKTSAGKKLHPRWRGLFVIVGPGGYHGKLYQIRQIDASVIPRIYYEDHLKLIKPREGYLRTGMEEVFPTFQRIRHGRPNRNRTKTPRLDVGYCDRALMHMK
ncbi:hypothetical protein K3495_g13513 [Podosphaera aphanis]|nr:hypothetical protein K3495_g13513 [Podosphaera aphanis]